MRCRAICVVGMMSSIGCGARTQLEVHEGTPLDAGIGVDAPPPVPCVAGVVASDLVTPWFLAVDEATIYWIDQNGAPGGTATLLGRCPKSGCSATPEILSSTITSAGGLAIDDTSVYWTDLGAGSAVSCSKLICTPRTLFTNPSDAPITLAVDGANLDILSYHSVEMCPTGGCATPTQLTSLMFGGLAIASDSSSVYYTVASPVGSPGGSIEACAKPACAGGPRVVVTSLPAAPWGIVVDDTNVYFAIGGAAADGDGVGEIHVCPKTGCGATSLVLVTGRAHPTTLVADADRLYWIEQGSAAHAFEDGVVASCAKSGCAGGPTVVASAQYLPNALAEDATCLYWSTGRNGAQSGTIQRAPK